MRPVYQQPKEDAKLCTSLQAILQVEGPAGGQCRRKLCFFHVRLWISLNHSDTQQCFSGKMPPPKQAGDSERDFYYGGKCICMDLIKSAAEAFLNMILEGLEELDPVVCAAMLQALTKVPEVVPSPGQTGSVVRMATEAAVTSAKTIAENSPSPSNLFDGWIETRCGIDKIPLNYNSTFNELVDQPDSVGTTSLGCMRKEKEECKKLPPEAGPLAGPQAGPLAGPEDDQEKRRPSHDGWAKRRPFEKRQAAGYEREVVPPPASRSRIGP